MIFIPVDEIIEELDYTKDYFIKLCRACRIDNRYILDSIDLAKLQDLPVVSNKSYELRIYINKLLDNR